MLFRPRVIPTLLIANGDLVKTKKFKNPNYLGDPINAIKIFNEKGVDELCILDITASKEGKEPDFTLLEKMATEAFMPLSYGGGVNSFEQAKRLYRLGFEKVIINSACFSNPELIKELSDYFGSQSVVCSIDYKSHIFAGCQAYAGDGTVNKKVAPLKLAEEYVKMGCGELLLYSIDKDGSRQGYDLNMIDTIAKSVSVPVIACGGANNVSDLKAALDAGASAVAAGSMFVYFGDRQAVLINYPTEEKLLQAGVYTERREK